MMKSQPMTCNTSRILNWFTQTKSESQNKSEEIKKTHFFVMITPRIMYTYRHRHRNRHHMNRRQWPLKRKEQQKTLF